MVPVNAEPIPDLLSIVLTLWLLGLALSILYAIFSGRIQMNGLFSTDVDNDGIADEYHPERVQLLLISLLGIGGYAVMTINAAAASPSALTVLPDVPEGLMMLLGASNSIYLSGKFGRSLTRG
ncbi:MAG: hypothetical protein K8S25_08725 [Alphaproteobacteria bacterium]|nr:hypothetical protein [Alphaproteobacteria bacterium]